MFIRLFVGALLATLLIACETPYKKSDAAEKKPLKDAAKDQSFQAFVGRLRIAVTKKDKVMMASMMTQDFGYRWDPAPPGELAFDYWDAHNVWPHISEVLNTQFEPKDLYMVAPPEAVKDPNYSGYRAGIRVVSGSWRFAYFVPSEAAAQ